MIKLLSHPLFFVFTTLFCTLYSQLISKWQINNIGASPQNRREMLIFWINLLLNPWILSGFFAAFVAALSWMMAIKKLPLSYAYPFMSLAFPSMIFFSAWLFHEKVSLGKWLGCLLIILGVFVLVQGQG